jgi:RimJ/RimL family protein N-acetyltransferase
MESDRRENPSNDDVQLRAVSPGDLPELFEHQLDHEASRMAAYPSRDEGAFMAHWTKILEDTTVLARTVLFEGRVAGKVVSWGDPDEPEVGYWIGREFWGRGIATAALSAFLEVETRRLLSAYVAGHNLASIRVLEKCGFTLAGDDSWSHPDGTVVDGIVMALEADRGRG